MNDTQRAIRILEGYCEFCDEKPDDHSFGCRLHPIRQLLDSLPNRPWGGYDFIEELGDLSDLAHPLHEDHISQSR